MLEVLEGTAYLKQGDTIREFETVELPSKFIRLQLDYKASIYDAIEKDEYVAISSSRRWPKSKSCHLTL